MTPDTWIWTTCITLWAISSTVSYRRGRPFIHAILWPPIWCVKTLIRIIGGIITAAAALSLIPRNE